MELCLHQTQPSQENISFPLFCMLKRSFSYVLQRFGNRDSDPFIPSLGMSNKELEKMLSFFSISMDDSQGGSLGTYLECYEEHKMLVEFFLRYRNRQGDMSLWIAHLLATASLGENHLWQDMGLKNRDELGSVLRAFFFPLFEANKEDMRWKRFFYRKLCEEEGLFVCKAPNCKDCLDRPICYGPE
ncbi:nitrogen fixation protein NifQ [Methylacidiphilum caldifontis]|nr:nitrogen fixation protein NifQ [Methylacidiphilum caldifontis]QSR89476.1 nitrogen fixation protein NifQ [Methylacidiphilum caldifontis]